MPPDLPNDQELTLKKRARRRLVGAIALVVLMIIVLPQVLQDRALVAQQEPIKITMPEISSPTNQNTVPQSVSEDSALNRSDAVSDQQDSEIIAPVTESVIDKPAEVSSLKVPDTKKQPEKTIEPTVEKKVVVKTPEVSKAENDASAQPKESFTVQVGVYSDIENVKRLQEQLKQAGFSTTTEKVKTPKGDSLRLKAGSFNSRQNAEVALAKIKTIGLSGIIVANE